MRLSGLLILAGLFLSSAAAAGAPSIQFVEHQAALFAGQPATLLLSVPTPSDSVGLSWELSIGNRTVAGGETIAPRQKDHFELSLPMPDVNSGVMIEGTLTVSLVGRHQPHHGELARLPLTLFHADAFATHRESLGKLKILLFDPVGNTAQVFKAAAIPFQLIDDLDSLTYAPAGVVMVGEGTSFEKQPGLATQLIASYRRGRSVLCLAPQAGPIPLPGISERSEMGIDSATFVTGQVIEQYDKRLRAHDVNHWSDAHSVGIAVATSPPNARIIGSVTAPEHGWAWFEARSSQPGRRFIVCGPGLMSAWDVRPTPRYFLAAVLQQLLVDRQGDASSPP